MNPWEVMMKICVGVLFLVALSWLPNSMDGIIGLVVLLALVFMGAIISFHLGALLLGLVGA